jgi:hypothetical protein
MNADAGLSEVRSSSGCAQSSHITHHYLNRRPLIQGVFNESINYGSGEYFMVGDYHPNHSRSFGGRQKVGKTATQLALCWLLAA